MKNLPTEKWLRLKAQYDELHKQELETLRFLQRITRQKTKICGQLSKLWHLAGGIDMDIAYPKDKDAQE